LVLLAGLMAGRSALAQSLANPMPPSPASAATQSSIPPLPPLGKLNQLQGKIVSNIKFRGMQENDRVFDRLHEVIVQEAGKPLDRQKVRRSLHSLYATGRFSDLQVEVQQTSPQELTLVFVATPNFFIGSMTAEGAPKRPTNSQIIDSAKLQLGEAVTKIKIEQALERMKTLMRQNGFYKAEITVEQTQHPVTQLTDLHFRVTPGDPAHIGQLLVEGDAGFTPEEIAKIANLEPGHTVNQERVTRALQKLRSKYTKQQ